MLPIKIELKRLYNSYLNEGLLRQVNANTYNEHENRLSMRGQNGFVSSIMRLIELHPELQEYYSNRKKNWKQEFEKNNCIYGKIAI